MVRCVWPFSCCRNSDVVWISEPVPESKNEIKPVDQRKRITELVNERNDGDKIGRREAVLVVGATTSELANDIPLEKIVKTEKDYKQIKSSLQKNDFLKNLLLDDIRLNAVIGAMHLVEFPADSYIIREGETGSHLYVSNTGSFQVIIDGKVVTRFDGGVVFGELAVLYKAKRFASIKAVTNATVWSLKRKNFQTIMVRTGKQEQEDNVKFLSSVSVLNGVQEANLLKIADCLKREFFPSGVKIVKQGERGDKFYIIRGGTVDITQKTTEGGSEKHIKELGRGDYFGEQALLQQDSAGDRRLATVTAKAPGVECLTISREQFNEYLGNIEKLKEVYPVPQVGMPNIVAGPNEYNHIKLNELEIVGTMGVGAFGRVELVQYVKDKKMTFALKCLKKVDIVMLQQQDNAFNEKNVMYQCKSPFICKLYKTYKDSKFLYFLMEPLLGGDVWTALQKKKYFDKNTARFMAACVIEAFDHLHSFGIVYRDLKPENLMLDTKGYVKLVDFGYAKYMPSNAKTYTFAGTPEYVAPEVIMGNGHDKAVDYWALGVFIYELLVGKPPFRGMNHVRTYNLIIRGIEAVEFDAKIPKIVQVLIKKLCQSIPSKRLGCLRDGVKDIRNQEWFKGFEWEKLRSQKMPAPFVRPVSSDKDLIHFDKYKKDEKVPRDETSGWDADF